MPCAPKRGLCRSGGSHKRLILLVKRLLAGDAYRQEKFCALPHMAPGLTGSPVRGLCAKGPAEAGLDAARRRPWNPAGSMPYTALAEP